MKDARASAITVRQLLTHVAGMPDVTDYAWDRPEYDAGALERYVRGLADSSLIAAPGAGWAYSNIGFEVLADLVAKVSGQEFEVYEREHILAPLGMTHSTLLMTDIDSTATGLGAQPRSDSGVVSARAAAYPYNRRHAASSTMHSDAHDMLRWADGQHAPRRAGRETDPPVPRRYDTLWRVERDMFKEIQARASQAGIELPYESFAPGNELVRAGVEGAPAHQSQRRRSRISHRSLPRP